MKKWISKLTTTHVILLSFLLAIVVGAGLLSLPVSAADGTSVPFLDALFTATTSVCVTGLVVVPTATAWSFFGQAVILVLIQIGGLGIITVVSCLMLMVQKRIGLGESLLLQDAFNLNSLAGLARFVRRVVLGTFLVEGVGALLYMTVFVPQFGLRGVWISVFNAVSAFCNAGIDVIGSNSLCDYVAHPMVNGVTCGLIILGSMGFPVWWDVLRVVRLKKRRRFRFLTLHSKLALSATAVLLVGGTALILLFEYGNAQTLGSLPFFQKLQAAFFQAVTTRTAGFITLPQEHLTNASSLVCLLLMFIGGSPVGTAGGIKTVTFVVLLGAAFASIRNRHDVSFFHRKVSSRTVAKALAVAGMSCMILFVSTVLLAAVTDASAMDLLYETVSATATVGLTRNLTSMLGAAGKWILIVTMYLGRVGPISLAVAFRVRKKDPNVVRDPVEAVSVG